jgi:hypothetical protein
VKNKMNHAEMRDSDDKTILIHISVKSERTFLPSFKKRMWSAISFAFRGRNASLLGSAVSDS